MRSRSPSRRAPTPPVIASVLPVALVFVVGTGIVGLSGCKKKASPEQCDQLLERFATLVVKEKHPDAGATQIEAEQKRERDEAKRDEAFRNCPSEVSKQELDCAMAAPTSEAMLKCLE